VTRRNKRPQSNLEYDVALSFAGKDRDVAYEVAELLRDREVRVFYDEYEQANLWGKDLYQHLQAVYRDKARFCVVFVSKHYVKRPWPRHELQQAQARAFLSDGEYILPLRLDSSELPGLNPTIGYVDIRQCSTEEVANLLLRKIYGEHYDHIFDNPPHWDGKHVEFRGDKVMSYWPQRLETAQKWPGYVVQRVLRRIPYGHETPHPDNDDRPCHDCSAVSGEYHVPGCDMEQCPQCGGQALGCSCIVDYAGAADVARAATALENQTEPHEETIDPPGV
jgi:hypothetical protein